MLPVHSGDLRLVPPAVRHDNGTVATGSAAHISLKKRRPPFFYAPVFPHTNPNNKLRSLRGYVCLPKYLKAVLANIYYPEGYHFPKTFSLYLYVQII